MPTASRSSSGWGATSNVRCSPGACAGPSKTASWPTATGPWCSPDGLLPRRRPSTRPPPDRSPSQSAASRTRPSRPDRTTNTRQALGHPAASKPRGPHMEIESIRSPFYEPAAAMGATFMEEGGWYWTDGFGDAEGEYDAVRNDLGVWDVSPLNKWEFRGPDALPAAQRVHSNNILGLAVGQVRYGALCDDDGLMVDDGTVYRLEDRVWVMTNSSEHAEHFAAATAGLDVAIEAITRNMPHLGLQGPRARQALAPLCPEGVTALGD